MANVLWKSTKFGSLLDVLQGRGWCCLHAASARIQLTQMDLMMSNLVQNCGGKSESLMSKNPVTVLILDVQK